MSYANPHQVGKFTPEGPSCEVCGKPTSGEVVIFDKAGTYQHYYHAECYRSTRKSPYPPKPEN